MELTKTEKELIDILKSKSFEKDEVVAILLALKIDSNFNDMFKWIKGNPDVTKDEIFENLYKIAK